MRKGTLGNLKYISLVILLFLAGFNIALLFKAREESAPNHTDPSTGNVFYVQPMGDVELDKLAVVKEILEENFNREVVILPKEKLRRSHYVSARNQYDALRIMNWAKAHMPYQGFRYIVVLDEDIFSDSLNFIFGQAEMPGKLCVISLARFADTENHIASWERALFKRRTANLLLHELGHTFNLQHCYNDDCVMKFANSLVELDNQPDHYCADCLAELGRAGIIHVFTETGEAVTYLHKATPQGNNNDNTIR